MQGLPCNTQRRAGKRITPAVVNCVLGPPPRGRHNAAVNAPAGDSSFAPPLDEASLTQWLQQWGPDDPAAGNHLFTRLYDELRTMARRHMRRESPDHTLSATGLTHEAWFRLSEQTRTQWRNRSHFLAVASTMMRRILVNRALARQAGKRDGDLVDRLMDAITPLADDGIIWAFRVPRALLAVVVGADGRSEAAPSPSPPSPALPGVIVAPLRLGAGPVCAIPIDRPPRPPPPRPPGPPTPPGPPPHPGFRSLAAGGTVPPAPPPK